MIYWCASRIIWWSWRCNLFNCLWINYKVITLIDSKWILLFKGRVLLYYLLVIWNLSCSHFLSHHKFMIYVFSLPNYIIELALFREQFLVKLFFLFREITCTSSYRYYMRPNHHQPKESKENCIQNSSHCAETLFSILQVKTLMPYCKIKG